MTALIVITALYVKHPEIVATSTSDTMLKISVASIFNFSNVGLSIGAIFVAICLTFFAFSTIVSWNLFGRINFEFLFDKKYTMVYSVISVVLAFLGSLISNGLVWNFNDFFNYLMVIPNAITLFALTNMVLSELKENGKKKKGEISCVPLSDKIIEK